MITNLPPLLVVVDKARALPLTIGWRPAPPLSCHPGWSAKEEAKGRWWEFRALRVVKL